ncbi:L-aspartate semialdehyde sulfurtransferase ferredoxin [Desulfovibrionales bacterium]
MTELIDVQRKIIILTFPPKISSKPIVCNLIRLFDLTFNILKAQITPRKEGYMTIELSGITENYNNGINYLKEHGIGISSAAQNISRNDESCMQCGMCTAICPSDTLTIDWLTRKVLFDKDRCTACGLCTRICPVRAMQIELEL